MPSGGFDFPTTYLSSVLTRGANIVSVYVTVQYTGTIQFHITAAASPTEDEWESITLVSGTRTNHVFATAGGEVKIRAVALPGAIIATTTDGNNNYDEPGIKIEMTYA